jgi:excisionase family DNA binding protein
MLYNKTEAAKLLRVSTKTVGRAVASGRLKGRLVGSLIRFSEDDLNQFVGARVMAEERKKAAEPFESDLIPKDILLKLEAEMKGISHGMVTLSVRLRDGRPRFVITRERSFIQDKNGEGS